MRTPRRPAPSSKPEPDPDGRGLKRLPTGTVRPLESVSGPLPGGLPRRARQPRFTGVGWPEIIAALGIDDDARLAAMGRYRTAGWTPEDFAGQWGARRAMAESLTYAEDQIEKKVDCPRLRAARSALRDVRRRLELELWP